MQLVEDLVKSYISGTSLILVTLPMSGACCCAGIGSTVLNSTMGIDDIENQKAARLAQLADPTGMRTIGEILSILIPSKLTASPQA